MSKEKINQILRFVINTGIPAELDSETAQEMLNMTSDYEQQIADLELEKNTWKWVAERLHPDIVVKRVEFHL
jgi:hypothetical protein